jgi:hypothetical protein
MFNNIYENTTGYNYNLEKVYINRQKIFNIKNYIEDGFEKVCDVLSTKDATEWFYSNINEELMYSDHRSWIYFLVIDNAIVKCGETGNPLGIPSKNKFLKETQPVTGTKSRFGRLRKQPGDTDQYLRESVVPYISNGHKVSLWAKKCPILNKEVKVAGQTTKVPTTMHKDLEIMYLEYFKTNAFCLPMFNKATK